jgi:hypothetical protein
MMSKRQNWPERLWLVRHGQSQRQTDVLNCGIADYRFDPDLRGLCVPELSLWNYGVPLEAEGAPKTSARDEITGTR